MRDEFPSLLCVCRFAAAGLTMNILTIFGPPRLERGIAAALRRW